MTSRRGVTLIEVLVASVLLGIGIAGTLNAMVASARLRVSADTREAIVGLMLDRLAWFEANACAVPDTAGVSRLDDGPEAHWSLQQVGSTRILELQAVGRGGTAPPRSHILTSLTCE